MGHSKSMGKQCGVRTVCGVVSKVNKWLYIFLECIYTVFLRMLQYTVVVKPELNVP